MDDNRDRLNIRILGGMLKSTGYVVCDANSTVLRELNPGHNDEFLREIAGISLGDTLLRIAELDQSLASDVRGLVAQVKAEFPRTQAALKTLLGG